MREWDYETMVDAARGDDRVVGLVLTGSRGRGPFARPDSDWDVRLVVRDDALVEAGPHYATGHGAVVEAAVYSLAGFERAGEIGTESEWDRYSYAHAEVVIDKLDGEIRRLVEAKGVLRADVARDVAAQALGVYLNSYYRSARNLGNGLTIEGQLDAVESVSPFLTALFALHERVRPFNKFLRWELEEFPLGGPCWAAEMLLPRLQAVTGCDQAEQRALFRDTEQLARARGHGEIVDGWEPHVPWLRGEAG